jgi:gamma-glutamyl phosphate reductase
MEYQKLHVITEEMYQQLLDMVFSKDENDLHLAEEIILNADTDDLNTCHYIEDICLMQVMINPNSKLSQFYINLKKQPNWKLVQDAYLAFQEKDFIINDVEYIYKKGKLVDIKSKDWLPKS